MGGTIRNLMMFTKHLVNEGLLNPFTKSIKFHNNKIDTLKNKFK
jgi:hypothetical protein